MQFNFFPSSLHDLLMIQTRNVALFSPTNQSGVYFASWESGKKLCTTKNTMFLGPLMTALTASLWG